VIGRREGSHVSGKRIRHWSNGTARSPSRSSLSVGAAYGLLALVFQHGVGANLLDFTQTDTIEAWVPLFLFSVLFGLSMD
jgi:uncharacterized membrane protein YdfJ with MMPL/SSD domain